jgi:hypothetical protein
MSSAIYRLRRLERINSQKTLGKRTEVELWFETGDGRARNSGTGEVVQLDELSRSGRSYLLFSESDARL